MSEFDISYIGNGETATDLGRGGLFVIQPERGYRFGVDAVLLAAFAASKPVSKYLDLCTGSAVVPILMSARTHGSFFGLEIQPGYADMGRRSVLANGLGGRISVITGDLRNIHEIFPAASFGAVTVNPPYIKAGCGIRSEDGKDAVCRHEILCDLDDVTRAASVMLVPGGRLYMVGRPKRLGDIFRAADKYKLGVETLRFVYPKADRQPNIVLISAVRGRGPELSVMPPLIVYGENGGYTKELIAIYND